MIPMHYLSPLLWLKLSVAVDAVDIAEMPLVAVSVAEIPLAKVHTAEMPLVALDTAEVPLVALPVRFLSPGSGVGMMLATVLTPASAAPYLPISVPRYAPSPLSVSKSLPAVLVSLFAHLATLAATAVSVSVAVLPVLLRSKNRPSPLPIARMSGSLVSRKNCPHQSS